MVNTRVHEIDLLRFMAALGVVFYHYAFRGPLDPSLSVLTYPAVAPIAQYGYLGVHLFFMISGFVILMTAARGGVAHFVISRAARLYPAFWICCTLTFLASLAIGGTRFSATTGQYLANLTLFGGFFDVKPIDGVYWSLFVELRFYALVLVILCFGRMAQMQTLLAIWLFISAGLQFLPYGKLHYLLIADYSAFFIAGATCYLIWLKGPAWQRIALLTSAWMLGLQQAKTEAAALSQRFEASFAPLAVNAIITAFFLLMLGIALRRSGGFGRRRWLLAGAVTYPLYLLHQNIGYMLFNRLAPMLDDRLLFWGVILLALATAYAVHLLVETPLAAWLKGQLGRLATASPLRRPSWLPARRSAAPEDA